MHELKEVKILSYLDGVRGYDAIIDKKKYYFDPFVSCCFSHKNYKMLENRTVKLHGHFYKPSCRDEGDRETFIPSDFIIAGNVPFYCMIDGTQMDYKEDIELYTCEKCGLEMTRAFTGSVLRGWIEKHENHEDLIPYEEYAKNGII